MNVKDLAAVLSNIQENRMISYDVVVSALKEGLAKAYRKHISCPDAMVRVDIDDKGVIRLYQQRKVIDTEVMDPDLEISLEDARELSESYNVDDIIEDEVGIEDFGRSTVSLVKNVMLQKIKEASKQMVYDEYIDKIDDLVYGTVQTVEDKFVLVDLGKTLALMTKADQIPGEKYFDGQRLKVIIKAVSKDTKGAQVIVSRSSANLVKRLFESSVTEIYDGTVEIKAIAREAGERTKMAVFSNNPNVDPIGACIGPRGARVLSVISEITQNGNPQSHENIDIFEWSPDFVQFIKNVMKPANVLSIIPQDDPKNLLIVVEDNQLSLAIGKKGINVKLAVKLLGRKIDIKTQSDVEAMGIDWYGAMQQFIAREETKRRLEAIERQEAEERAREEALAAEEAARKAEEEARKAAEEAEKAEPVIEEQPAIEEVAVEEKPQEEKAEPVVEEQPVAEVKPEPVKEEVKAEETEEPEEKETTKKRKPKLEIKANEYVSKYEELADAKKASKQTSSSRKKKASKEEEENEELKKKLEALKARDYDIKPEYSEEELEEFNNDDDDHWYDEDVDYDDYDEFYDN
ncbi:MAG: transcription termination/antitermination protein NusA [Erysipelotrichaceae bacterium]|nr:transcription termination/antitermination protein NusA [Erysipelotrichaceae bacterium]